MTRARAINAHPITVFCRGQRAALEGYNHAEASFGVSDPPRINETGAGDESDAG
jgi:hypothetical protein